MDKALRNIVYFTFGVSIAFYLTQLFTPLRLTTDSIAYLSLADTAAREGFFHALKQPKFPFPKGYPAFIFLFMKAGIFSSTALVISNLLLFAAGLIFSFRTLTSLGCERSHALIACLFTLVSFTAVKFVTQGMSDFLFFALSACACWLITLQNRYRWAAILLCVACAIEVRFIGLALIAPIAVSIWPFIRRRPVALAVAAAATFGCLCAGIWAGHHYLASNLQIFRNNGLGRFATRNLVAHFQDFGELAGNAPLSQLPHWIHGPALVLGSVALVFFFMGIIALWARCQWLCCYLIAYSGLILPWPYSDPRFWLPAMPFVVFTVHAGIMAVFKSIPTRALVVYGAIFCALGFVAMGYSTRLTFAGSQFAYRYGDGRLRSTYLTHCSIPTGIVEEPALNLLRRYEWGCPEVQ
jgi:hypothetical protein